jgi:WD40 repeat protein
MLDSDTSEEQSPLRRLTKGCLLVVAVPLLVWFSLWLLLPNPLLQVWPVGPESPLPVSADGQLYGVPSGRGKTKQLRNFDVSGRTTLMLRQVADGAVVGTFGAWGVNNIAVSADRRLLATSSWDQTVQIWQMRDGALLRTMQHTQFFGPDDIDGLAFSPDNQWLASGGDDGVIRVWRVGDGAALQTFQVEGYVKEVAFSPDRQFLAAAIKGNKNSLTLWQVSDWKVFRRLDLGYTGPTSLAFSPDGRFLAAGFQVDTGGQVQVWRAFGSDPQPEHTFYSLHWVFAVVFSPDGQLLAAGGGADGSGSPIGSWRILPPHKPITIWRVGGAWSDWPVQTLSSPQGYIKDLAFTSDSQQLVSSGGFSEGGGSIALFTVAPGRALWDWLVPISAVAALAWVVWQWRRGRRMGL